MIATIDFETLDTKASSYLLSVALTAFDLDATNTWQELEQNSMHIVFDERGQENRTKSLNTQEWWKQQSHVAWEYATIPANDGHTYPLICGLIAISKWIEKHKVQSLVGNGVGFDNAILDHACEQHGVKYPLPYWSDLDLRTMKFMSGEDKLPFPNGATQHYALHDAIYEAQCAQHYAKRLNDKRSNGGAHV